MKMKTYKGMTKMEMVKKIVAVMVAEFEEKNAKEGKKIYNTDERDLISHYMTYPMASKKYTAFSVVGMYEAYCG